MANLLVIEGGRSRSSATVVSDAHEVVRIDGLALPYLSGGSLDPLLSVLSDLVKSVVSHDRRFDAVVLGLAPIRNDADADVVAAHVRSLLVARTVVVTSDAVIHYAGALGGQPGVVVCAGTGVHALAATVDGRTWSSGAWGYILGDDGSGYAIGRRALAAAFRDLDGRAREPAIRAAAEELYGPLAFLSMSLYHEPNPVTTVARFAPRVAQLARDGNQLAARIWSDAADEIARSTLAAAEALFGRGEPLEVRWAGGLFDAGDLLVNPFCEAVLAGWPTACIRPATGGPVDGGLLLARATIPAIEKLVYRL
jgi:N-acetylglucosamine kinase-like BadF-type ATPase